MTTVAELLPQISSDSGVEGDRISLLFNGTPLSGELSVLFIVRQKPKSQGLLHQIGRPDSGCHQIWSGTGFRASTTEISTGFLQRGRCKSNCQNVHECTCLMGVLYCC